MGLLSRKPRGSRMSSLAPSKAGDGPPTPRTIALTAAPRGTAARRMTPPAADTAALAARLRTDAEARSELISLLGGGGGRNKFGSELDVADWLRARGCVSGPSELSYALTRSRLDDPAAWTGRYTLFVQWSADGAHPWDGASGAAEPAATLELAVLDTGGVAAFLDGAAVDFAFEDGVLRTVTSLPCASPDGTATRVHLQLAFSAGSRAAAQQGVSGEDDTAYVAPQCHGLLWHDGATGQPPANWPVAPPRVSGKANMAARGAAASPAVLPSLSAFDGEYDTLLLPPPSSINVARDGAARRGPGLTIANGVVTLGGRRVPTATFSRASVLSWTASPAAAAGWLHCAHLPAGPLLLGRLEGVDGGDASSEFNFMAERAGGASVFLSVDAIDTSAALLDAAGLGAAASADVGAALDAAIAAWRGEAAAIAIATAAARAAAGADAQRRALETAFGPAGTGLVVSPEESVGAARAQEAAAEHARSAKHAAGVAEAAAAVAAACGAARRAGGAAAKSAAAAFNAARAASSSSAAEEAALWAASHAAATRMAGSLYVAAVAAASFNDAKDGARAAAQAASDAGAAALGAVQRHLADLALTTDYAAVKDAADAASACTAAADLAAAALSAWEAGTAAARARVPDLTASAADKAADGARFLREAVMADGGGDAVAPPMAFEGTGSGAGASPDQYDESPSPSPVAGLSSVDEAPLYAGLEASAYGSLDE